MTHTDDLLGILVQLTGRSVFPEDDLREIIGTSDRYLKAYNLCNGTQTQAEVVKAVKIDAGNFSRMVSQWIDKGVIFRLGEGKGSTLLHLHPLTAVPRSTGKSNKQKD